MKVYIKEEEFDVEIGKSIGEVFCGLNYDSSLIGATINGELSDLFHIVRENDKLVPVFKDTELGLGLIRHTAAHVLAEAVQAVYPETKVTIGPNFSCKALAFSMVLLVKYICSKPMFFRA